eukprot:GGOE01015631.1.p1 GENE.GGOE01015631.1~~GGOE01015631.1.p1  ORF type:complete len:710 (-),score=116.85 GGOE01015631.1:164-2122(-)
MLKFVRHELLKTVVPVLVVMEAVQMRLYMLRLGVFSDRPFGMHCTLCRRVQGCTPTKVFVGDGPTVKLLFDTGIAQSFAFNPSTVSWEENVIHSPHPPPPMPLLASCPNLDSCPPAAWLTALIGNLRLRITACANTWVPVQTTRFDGGPEERADLQMAFVASDEPMLRCYSHSSGEVFKSVEQPIQGAVVELVCAHTGPASLCLAMLTESGGCSLYNVTPGQAKVDLRCFWRSEGALYIRCCSFPGQLWQSIAVIHLQAEAHSTLVLSLLSQCTRLWLSGPPFCSTSTPISEALHADASATSSRLHSTLLPVLAHRHAQGIAALGAARQRLQCRQRFQESCCRILKELRAEQRSGPVDWAPFPPGPGLLVSFVDFATRPMPEPPPRFYVPMFCGRGDGEPDRKRHCGDDTVMPPSSSSCPTALLHWRISSPAAAISLAAPIVSYSVSAAGTSELFVPWNPSVDTSKLVLLRCQPASDDGNFLPCVPTSASPASNTTTSWLAWNLSGVGPQELRKSLERCAPADAAVSVSISAWGSDGLLFSLGAPHPIGTAKFLRSLCGALPQGCVLLPNPLNRDTLQAVATAAKQFSDLLDTSDGVYTAVQTLERSGTTRRTTPRDAYCGWLQAMSRYVSSCAAVYAAGDPQLLQSVSHKR